MNLKEMESELGTVLVKKKKEKKKEWYQAEANSRSLNTKESDTNNSLVNVVSIDKGRTKEDAEKPFKVFDVSKSKKFSNTSLTDVEEFASKSVDVVVDIHREYMCDKHQEQNIEKTEKRLESFEVFSKANTFQEKRSKRSRVNSTRNQGPKRERHDNTKIVESLDLIEEFRESSLEEKHVALSSGRRQWDGLETRTERPKKPPRKRWSKNTSVIRLPEAKGIPWMISSKENVSSLIEDSKQPSAAVQILLKQKSRSGIDNAAFVSENEEILRIETNFNQEDTKIKMTDVNKLEETELSSVSDRSLRNSLIEERLSEKGTITIEDLNESKNSATQNIDDERKHAIVDIESFDEDNMSLNQRFRKRNSEEIDETNSDESNISRSLEEVTARSNCRSFEEVLIEDEELRSNKKNKMDKKHFTDSDTRSDRSVTSTTEDDNLDENKSRKTRDENRSRSIAKRKRLKHVDHRHTLQREKERKKVVQKNVSAPGLGIKEESKKKKKKKKGIKYISIMIHRTDMLKIDYITKHPMVKVHIMEAETGKYLKGENGHLQPIITGKFDFKENRSIIPLWEEELIFEHNFDALLKVNNEQVVILFEVVDLLSFAEASFNYDKLGHEGCWYKIAWAFLKLVGRNDVLHVNKRVRLQLYKPGKSLKKFERFHTCEVYTWWKSSNREKYSSSLFVTVMPIDPPKLEPIFYQQLSLHDFSDICSESQKASTRTSDSINLPKWTRLAAQSCKIPNENIFETDISENGCFFAAFSNDGKYLACILSEEHDYPIIVYEIEAKEVYIRFSGHKTFVYSLDFSNNDNYLLSVSSDQTARIWDIQNQIIQYIQMMPHPSYVYCGKFDPESTAIVATGCYDRIARIWIRNRKSKNRDLSQELEGHEGFINSMCFQKNSNLLTADSVGIIIIWTVKKNRRISSKKEWHISRKIRVREIDGVIINTILLHPLESRLLVHSRNNGLRMLDLATGVVLQKYYELNNRRIQTTACISPCGGLILCGGEDASLTVWNLETGSLLAKYTFNRNFRAVTCVDYHPYDHVLVYTTFGSPAPVKVLRFNKDAVGEDVGLQMMKEAENKMSNDIPVRFSNASVTFRERSRLNSTMQMLEETSKERGLPSSQNHKFNPVASLDSMLSKKDNKYTEAKLKLQRLTETEQTLKSRSASRLYNIIEKIDRILSNTSRSSGDVESGKNFSFVQDASKVLTRQNASTEDKRIKMRRHKPLAYFDDHSSLYFESSTENSDKKDEALELKKLPKIGDWNTKRKSNSAKEIRNNNMRKDYVLKTFSDSATDYRKTKIHDNIKAMSPKLIESSFILQTKESGSKSTHFYKDDSFDNDHSNSSNSAGTYVVQKSNVEKNSDEGLIKLLGNEDSIQSDTEDDDLDIIKRSESESSVPSNATFTIESEVPIPKSMRKKNVT